MVNKESKEHIDTLRYMLSVLMVRQSSWELTEEEKQLTREGINALRAAVELMDIQVYA